MKQFNYVKLCMHHNLKIDAKKFFALSKSNCIDCPFMDYGRCYTHKYMQFSGFVSMIKSIVKKYEFFSNIKEIDKNDIVDILQLSANRFVRFGSYGEPSLIPLDIVSIMAQSAKNYTGYTHQWIKNDMQGYKDYFMASVESDALASVALNKGWRYFYVLDTFNQIDVICPASKEKGFITNCSTCGLCSGAKGKGKKSIQIIEH